jgi:equilibrative nucleoside transporter 1/2/3
MLAALAKRLVPGGGPRSPERLRYHTLSSSPDSRRSSMVLLSETPLSQSGLLEPGVPHSSSERKIEFVHFILGACVLIPWNGTLHIAEAHTRRHSSNLAIVLITATPYFLARLQDSPFRSTFSFYLSITMCISNFGFLLHAVITAKSVRHFLPPA